MGSLIPGVWAGSIICWELSMRMTEHGIARAKNSWKSKLKSMYSILNLAFLDIFDFWWVWMSVGAQPAIQLPVGWLYWFTLLQSLLWTDSWDGCNLAALFKHDKQETLELFRFMSEQSISSLTLGFPILTKKPEELSGSTLIVVRFFLNFHCGQRNLSLRWFCHGKCRNLDGLVSGEAMSKPSTSTVCGTAGDRCALPEIEVLTNISKVVQYPFISSWHFADLGTTPFVLLEPRSGQFGRFSVAITWTRRVHVNKDW